MGYCFMTLEKITNSGTMVRKFEHNYRTEKVPNAIPELKNENEELVKLLDNHGNPTTYLNAFHDRLNSLEYYKSHKLRSDAVKAYEVVTTFSRDDRNKIDIEQWKNDNVKWLRDTFNRNPEKYGDNVISVMYHGDECGNVHCHAFILPVDERGHFCATSFTNGRSAMIKLQDSYAKAMEKHELERGVRGSSAVHQDIKKFYARLNGKLDVPFPEPGENALAYRQRILSVIQDERAASFRELLQKETRIRQKLDERKNRDMEAIKGAAIAEVAKKKIESERLDCSIAEKAAELQKKTADIADLDKEYDSLRDKAQHVMAMIHGIEEMKKKADSYDQLMDIMEYARQEIPDFAETLERNYNSLAEMYETREIEI